MKRRSSQRAKELHRKFKTMRPVWRALWVQYGRYGIEFDDNAMYVEMGFGSFKSYWKSLRNAMPYSTIAEAMQVIRAFPKMKDTELIEYPKENLKIISKLPARRQLVYMSAAKVMESNELRDLVNKKDEAHLEAKTKIVFIVEKSVREVCEAAIEKMQQDVEDEEIDRHQAFALIMARFVVGDSVAIVKQPTAPKARGRVLNLE